MPLSFPLRTTQLIAPSSSSSSPPSIKEGASESKAGLRSSQPKKLQRRIVLPMYPSMTMVNGRHIPAFGSWDYCDDLPITQYFESAMQAGVLRPAHYFSAEEDDADDLFPPAKSAAYQYHHQKKAKRGGGEKQAQAQPRKQMGKVCDVSAQAARARRARAGKAVDEDLYKIPPELLCQKSKRKRLLRSLWSGCLGISCSGGA